MVGALYSDVYRASENGGSKLSRDTIDNDKDMSLDIYGDSTPAINGVFVADSDGGGPQIGKGDGDSEDDLLIRADDDDGDDDDDDDDDDDEFKVSVNAALLLNNDSESFGELLHCEISQILSVESDSPVHSSSSESDSDDLAAFLETELDYESEDDAEVSNHRYQSIKFFWMSFRVTKSSCIRLKRQKLEHIETVDEEGIKEISEASSSKGVCKHSFIGNLCYLCGQNLVEETGVSIRYTHMDMRLDPDEVLWLRDSDMRALHRQRKLCLVLDLDQTLLNTTNLRELEEEEEYLKSHTHSLQDVSGGDLFMLEFMNMMTKLRPFVRQFLKEASEMFVLYIYTAGDRTYALQMAKLLDPKGDYFGDRIISRGDNTVRHQKSLDVVPEHESSVLILDDTENAWPNDKDHLIVIERYHFFASSCRLFDHKYQSLSQLRSDESEPDGALATVLRVLKQTHRLFFEDGVGDTSSRDVRLILKQVRKEILKGCKVVFSRVFRTQSKPKDHMLWRMAEGLGATCATELDASVTHVIAMDMGTKKVSRAKKEKKFVVHRGWLDAAHFLWKKPPEENFALEQLNKETTIG